MDEETFDGLVGRVQHAFDQHEALALIQSNELLRRLWDNPKEAVPFIKRLYDQGLDEASTDEDGHNYRCFVEAMCDGPLESIPWSIYNAVGSVYPYLEREDKDAVLQGVLNIVGPMNYAIVNGARGPGHTTGIREPLLLADLGSIRGRLYWPGHEDEEKFLSQFGTFEEFHEQCMENGSFKPEAVRSDFLLAMPLLKPKYSSWGGEYASVANPSFLDRVAEGIVNFHYSHRHEPEHLEENMAFLLKKYHPAIHDRFGPAIEKEGWVEVAKFN